MDKNQHKDLDKFFQNKLNDRQFEYQDDFWAEMETLLPEEDTDTTITGNSRRRFIGGILLLLLIGFTAWFSYPFAIPSSEKQLQTTLKTESSEAVNKTVQSNDLSTKSIISKNKQNNINQKNTNTATTQPIDNQINSKKSTKIKTITYDKSNKVTGEPTNVVINNFEKNVQVPNQLLNNKNGRPFPTNIIEESTKKTTIKNQNKQPLAVFNNEPIIDENQKNNTTQPTNLLNSNIKKEVVAVVNNKNNQLSDYTYLTTFSLEDIAKKEPNEVSRIEPTCDGCPHLPSLKSLDIGLIAGLSASQGWKNTLNNRASASLDPAIGLRLEYASNPIAEWTWNMEILYWSRSSLNAQYGYDSTSYGFGATTVSRSINIEELHNIALPIYVVYNKDKHQFMGGLNLNYIINAQSTTTGVGHFYSANNIENFDVATTEQWGYTSAFNRFEVGLTVGYDYEVRKGWRLGTRINYGLTDVAKNNVFNNNTFDNNLNIRLLLTCDLLEFKF